MDIYKKHDIEALITGNPYVGRGIVAGLSENGRYAVAAYFIMGRSANSRNRIFTKKNGEIFTEPFDASKVEDPSLIIYAALRKLGNKLIFTNGDQTDTIYEGVKCGATFAGALATREFEPDKPNFTPRISCMMTLGEPLTYEMSILKSEDENGSDCCRFTFAYKAQPGLGHFIHTYVTDGDPIPTFQGEPERVIITDDINEFTDKLWRGLDTNNKISLYVRYTDLESGEETDRLINKNK